MSKTMQYAYDTAEQQVESIIEKMKDNIISKIQAKNDIMKVSNLNMLGIDDYNIDEFLEEEYNQ